MCGQVKESDYLYCVRAIDLFSRLSLNAGSLLVGVEDEAIGYSQG